MTLLNRSILALMRLHRRDFVDPAEKLALAGFIVLAIGNSVVAYVLLPSPAAIVLFIAAALTVTLGVGFLVMNHFNSHVGLYVIYGIMSANEELQAYVTKSIYPPSRFLRDVKFSKIFSPNLTNILVGHYRDYAVDPFLIRKEYGQAAVEEFMREMDAYKLRLEFEPADVYAMKDSLVTVHEVELARRLYSRAIVLRGEIHHHLVLGNRTAQLQSRYTAISQDAFEIKRLVQ